MIHYKDRTFCSYYKECKIGSTCNSALTPDVEKGAQAIGLPISRWVNKPACFAQKEKVVL